MKVRRSKLIKALQLVESGLSRNKETVVQASCYVFKDGRIMTFNDEVYCSIPFAVGFEGAVGGRAFIETLGRFKEEDITFDLKDREVVVRGSGKRAGFKLESEILLPVGEVSHPDEADWQPADAGLSAALGNVASCVGTDEEKFYRTCVNVTATYVEACDNYHMMRAPVKTALTGEGSFLVRGLSIKPLDGLVIERVACTDDWLCFRCNDELDYYCRRYIDDFPNLDLYFNKDIEGSRFVPPAGFSEAIETAQIFTSENEIETVKVEMRDRRMRISGQGATGWYEELFTVDYRGQPMGFAAPPKLLRSFAEKHAEGVLGPTMLRVTADDFVYITSLDSV